MNTQWRTLLAMVFTEPRTVSTFDLPAWSELVSQARRANVLARLGFLLQEHQLLENAPPQPRLHIHSAQVYANRFELSLKQELAFIQNALADIDVPLILLKGSGYFAAGNQAAKGRIFTDIDILVPENKLAQTEEALIESGWMTSTLDSYDQHYYRQWMHEIPPMRHLQRQTTVDVHHNILPKTSKFYPDAAKLVANAVQLPDGKAWVFAAEDRVLHSAAHLFLGGEWDQGFRDLSDIDLLLKEFSVVPGFWERLMQRAVELKQQLALFLLLRYTSKMLRTPIPAEVMEAAQVFAPLTLNLPVADALFMRALLPNHPSCNNNLRDLACWLLLIRSHWLRMPLRLLLPHLAYKAWRHGFSDN